ncbi:hypothetical protein PoB_000059500 [Plakobranchus ocellatus]|uniref:Uncharacterized protein n=1 Tax=Plakobranchus ocellatus TaxID=259542 RepID=A0AAV3XSW1_9GAST|nr:hypothetical protein PoB_000059500 [Plakobranchus ocellatus]
MVKAFRPSLEPPAHRQVRVTQTARPGLCLLVCAGVTALLIGGFVASGWNVYVNRFDKNRFRFSSGDEVAVSDVSSDFSSMYCDSYEVKLWAKGQVYLLPNKAKVNTSLIGQEECFSMLQIPGLAFRETSLYLLDQSELSFSVCRQNGSLQLPAEVIIMKGNTNLMNWRKNKECSDCTLHRVEIPLNALCGGDIEQREALSGEIDMVGTEDLTDYLKNEHLIKATLREHKERNVTQQKASEMSSIKVSRHFNAWNPAASSRPLQFNYTVKGNDKYFLIIFYGRPVGPESVFTNPGIQIQGRVKRTSFNLKDATQVCNLTMVHPYDFQSANSSFDSCLFDLPWGSDQDVVVHFGESLPHDHEDSCRKHELGARRDSGIHSGSSIVLSDPNHGQEGMVTKCHIRLVIWVCLFVVLPIVLGLVFSAVVGCFLCRSRPPQQFAARWRRHRHGKRKRNLGGEIRVKDNEVLVDAEVLPEGDQSTMAIQGE